MALHLFEIEYDRGDEPYTYVAETLDGAIAAYRRDAGNDAVVIGTRQVPDDEVVKFSDDGTIRELRAAEGSEGQCVLCDAHYV